MSDNKLKRVLCLFLAMLFIFFELSSAVLAVSESDIKVNNVKSGTNTIEQKTDKGKEVLEEDKEKEEAKSKIESLKKALEEKFKSDKEIKEVQIDNTDIQKDNNVTETSNDSENHNNITKNKVKNGEINDVKEVKDDEEVILTPENSTVEEPKKLTDEEYQKIVSESENDEKIGSELDKDSELNKDDFIDTEINNYQDNKRDINSNYSDITTKSRELDNILYHSNITKEKNILELSDKNEFQPMTATEPSGEDISAEIRLNWLEGNIETSNTVSHQDWTSKSKDIKGRIHYKISNGNDEEFKPGELEITMPRYLYNSRTGEKIGEITLGVPRFPSTRQPIAYVDTGEFIKFINTRSLPKTTEAYIEFTYKAVKPELIKDNEVSNTINAAINLTHNELSVNREATNKLTTRVNTKAVIDSINDGISSPYGYPYEVYPDIFPDDLKPQDSDNYVYADYTFNMGHSATQPYKVKFESQVESYGGKILGIRSSSDNTVIKNENNSGSMSIDINSANKFGNNLSRNNYMRIFVAYPINQFTEQKVYNLEIKGKYILTSEDDKEVTSKEVSEVVGYKPIKFVAPDNHFGITKYGDGRSKTWTGYKYEGNYNYALNGVSLGRDIDLSYDTYVQTFALPFTYPGFNPKTNNKDENLDNYKQNKFKTVVTDGEVETSYQDLNYQIKSVSISNLSLYDYIKYPSSSNGFFEDSNGRIQYGHIPIGYFGYKSKSNLSEFLIKDKSYDFQILGSKDGNNYVPYAKVNIDSGLTLEGLNSATIEDNTVVFPKGVQKYKVELESGIPGYSYELKPTITIKADDKSKTFADNVLSKDKPLSRIKTLGSMVGITQNNQIIDSKPDYAYDKVMGLVSGARLYDTLNYDNDTYNSRVKVNYKVTMQHQTNQTELDNIKSAVELGILKEENKGTWYILLPVGFDLNINSIEAARPSDTILNKSIKKNYRKSGRDLIKIEMKQIPKYRMIFSGNNNNFIGIDGYTDEPAITFSGNYSWAMMRSQADRLPNGGVKYKLKLDSVYKSSNEYMGSLNGFKGETSSAENGQNRYTPSIVLDIMKNIEGTDNSNRYLFSKSNRSISVDTSGIVGVDKLVDVNNEGDFTSGTSSDDNKSVYENGYYTYRITASTNDKSKISNLIIYDKLDGYELNKDDKEFGSKTFRGKFQSLDLSMAESLGINPTVYYSTKQDIDIGPQVTEDMKNLNSDVWTTKEPTNREKITAIAVDLSKKTDNSDFILDKNQTIMINVGMKSPTIAEVGADSYAFNKSTLSYKKITLSENVQEITPTQKTKIGIKPFGIDIYAKWDDDSDRDGKRPKNGEIKAKLIKNGNDVVKEFNLNENKLFDEINGVEYLNNNGAPNNYTIQIIDGSKDYNYIINGPNKQNDSLKFNITAKHEPEKIDVSVKKVWEGKKIGAIRKYEESYTNRPSSIKLTLYKNGKSYIPVTVVPDKDNNWTYTVKDQYKYENKGQEIKYEFKEDEYIKGYIPAEYSDDGRIVINKYYPFGDLTITKNLIDATSEAKKQTFKFEVKIESPDKSGSGYNLNMNSYSYETSSGTKGKISTGGIIEMKSVNGEPESITIKDIPTESKVTIVEQDKPGFTAVRKIQNVEIQSGRTQEMQFENKYNSSGKVMLKASKKVEGRKLDSFLFLFDLIDKNGKIIQSVRNGSDGSIYFQPLEYTLSDINKDTSKSTIEYVIRERQDNRAGYIHDNKEYKVIVKLQDNGDGTITAIPTYTIDGKNIDIPEFTNTYSAKSDLNITAYKSIKYTTEKPAEGTITYTLYDKDGITPIKDKKGKEITGINDSQGKVVLNSKDYYTEKDSGKTFGYVIKETKYDTNIFQENKEYLKFKDTLKDNGDGTLSITQEYLGRYDENNKKINDESDVIPRLENIGKSSDINVIKKVSEGHKEPNKEFKFKIKFTGDKENIPKSLEIIKSDGTVLNNARLMSNSVLGNKLTNNEVPEVRQPNVVLMNEIGLSISDFVEPEVITNFSDTTDNNPTARSMDGGYVAYKDKGDEYATNLNVINSYSDGLILNYHSNNGETKSFREEYAPKTALDGIETFSGNKQNWGNKDNKNKDLIIKGWSLEEKSNKIEYKVGSKIKDSDIYEKRSGESSTLNEVNLYAVWGKPGFMITFDSNGGQGSMDMQEVEYNTAMTLAENKFYQLGKKFAGWSKTPNGEVDYSDKSTLNMPESEIKGDKLTLYAIWEDDNLNLKSDNGEFEFTLRENEMATLKNIPSHLKYEITEVKDSAWGLISSKNSTGISKPTMNELSEFTNKYGAKSTQYVVKGIKQINGVPSSLDDFSFELEDLNSHKKYVTKSDSKTGEFSFEPLIFTTPGTYKYKLIELKHDNPSYTHDDNIYYLNINVKENGGELAATSNINNIIFNNTIKKSQIIVTKDIQGDWLNENQEFKFKSVIGDKEEEFTLTNGQSKTIDTVYGANYKIEELSQGNWITTSTNESGVVNKDKIEVHFTNTSILDITDDSGPNKTIQFKKELIGRDLEGGEFFFNLTFRDSNGNELRQVKVDNDKNGIVSGEFSELLFKKSSTVDIQEIPGTDDSVEYDTNIYTYKITKDGDNYILTNSDGNSLDNLVVQNKLKQGLLNVKLNVLNTTEKNKDKEFSIKVKVGDNIISYQLKNGENKDISIPIGKKYEITSDNLPKGFKLKDITNKSGSISSTLPVNSVVTLEYSGEATLPISASKILLDENGEESKELIGKYVFNYILTNNDGEVIGRAKNDSNGSIAFSDLKYTLKDAGKEYIYYLNELEDGQFGIIFDKSQFKITVKVEDSGSGLNLSVKKEQILDNKSTEVENLVFKNQYKLPIDAPLTGYKYSKITVTILSSMLIVGLVVYKRRKYFGNK